MLLIFDKALAKHANGSIVCPSLSFPLFVIPSRLTVVVPLHSTASSTCLFTYSLSSSPINIPPPHSVSILHSLDNSHTATLSLSLHFASSSVPCSSPGLHPSISPLLPLSPPHICLLLLQWKKGEAIQKVIFNTGYC